jgi:hypothetical protein
MAAEALVSLSRPDAVVPWVERYRRDLDAAPSVGRPIALETWREALGDFSRAGDWSLFFLHRLEEEHWTAVLATWCRRLAPGIVAAAFHGVIRTAHAARSLGRRETPARRREFAEGLAYWASRYETLPEAPGLAPAGRLPSEALPDVDVRATAGRAGVLITDRLRLLSGLPSFARVADLTDAGGDPSQFLSDHALTFARAYLEHVNDRTRIALIHAVTGPSAVRMLLPYLDRADTPRILRYTWQAAAALYAVSAGARSGPRGDTSRVPRDDLIERAVSTRDEHGFKFVEACLREDALRPDPAFPAAALEATEHLRGD